MGFFLPVLALQLSDELPLLFVDVKIYAAVGYHLSRVSVIHQSPHKQQDRKVSDGRQVSEGVTYPSAVALSQLAGVAGDQFVLFVLPAVAVNTAHTHAHHTHAQAGDQIIFLFLHILNSSN